MSKSSWQRLAEDLFLYQDSCSVYAVRGPGGTVLVNAGTGACADHLGEIHTGGELLLLLTHHFRDHTDGAIRMAARGAKVLAPWWERDFLLDPDQHFRQRLTWCNIDTQWDHFAPVRPIPVSDWMMDYQIRTLAGLKWKTVPVPGVTQGASAYIVEHHGRQIALAGEMCSAGGKIPRMAPLQYNYIDLWPGLLNLWHSLERVMQEQPDLILPSHGPPLDDPAAAAETLRHNIRQWEQIQGLDRKAYGSGLDDPQEDDIEEILPHLWRSRRGNANAYFIISERSGRPKALALDYGFDVGQWVGPAFSLQQRRPLLHGMNGLKKRFGIDRIDTVLASHYHDDHVCGIPLLQRLYGTRCWAGRWFADLLQRPHRHMRPCLWPEPITVHKAMEEGKTAYWEDVPITCHAMTGHTKYSALLLLEVDGVRVAHTGDQIFYGLPGRGGRIVDYQADARLYHAHVYRNGLPSLEGYRQAMGHLQQFRPQLILSGHIPAYKPAENWLEVLEEGAAVFDEMHKLLMPLGPEECHFGPDSQGGELLPYRMHLPSGSPPVARFEGWVRNPFPKRASAMVELIVPDGWACSPLTLEMEPRTDVPFQIELRIPEGMTCRRQPIGLDLTVDGRPFGQVAEALVTVGRAFF